MHHMHVSLDKAERLTGLPTAAPRQAVPVDARDEPHLGDRLQTALEIAEVLTTTLDRATILRTTVTEMIRVLGVDGSTIRIVEGDHAPVAAWAGIDDAVAAQLPDLRVDEDWLGEVFRTRRPLVRNDVPAGADELDPGASGADELDPGDRYADQLRFCADLSIPLIRGERVIGALSSFSMAARRWTPADIAFAAAIGTHASIALHNADLFAQSEARAAQLGVLQAASARMSRQNSVESVGRAIVEEVGRIIDYHNCRVYMLIDPDQLVPIAFEGRFGAYDKVDLDLLRTTVGVGFTGWVAANGTPLLIHEANADPRGSTIPGTDDVDESMLCVPMRYDERVIGVITLSKLGLRQFDGSDQRLLTILADQAATAVESARLLSRSERLAGELRQLLDMSSALSQSLDPREVAELIARHLVEAMGVDECVISWWDRPGERLITLGYWPPIPTEEVQPIFELTGYPETTRVLEAQQAVVIDVDDPSADPAEIGFLRDQGGAVSAMLPLVAKGRSIGLVELISRSHVQLDDALLALARTMANEAAVALENARLYEDARNLADRDQLTGYFNHRYLHERLGEELLRAQRSGAPLAILMIDLDDFKLVNDQFGHLLGDRLLAWAAAQIRSTLRESDIAARYGGDEFAIILPDTDAAAAHRAARRILGALRERAFDGGAHGPVSVAASIGIAASPAHGRFAQELIAVADVEMYRVKRAGGRAAGRLDDPGHGAPDPSPALAPALAGAGSLVGRRVAAASGRTDTEQLDAPPDS